MRLDYTLYGLAIISFIVAAVSLVVVSDQTGKMILTVSTAVIGLVAVSTGFMCKPKVQTGASTPVPAVTQASEQIPQVPATVEAPAVESPKIETAPAVDATATETVTAVAASPVETPQAEAPVASEAVTEALVEVPAPIAVSEASSPTSEVSPVAPTPEASDSLALTQVKGIGEKRAVQLKVNGITSIDDLAKADTADLAAKLKVSPKIVEKWIAGAKDLTK